MKSTRVVLVDDQLLVRAGIRALIEALPAFEVVAECEDGKAGIEAVQQLRPEIVLLDIAMPGPSGIEVARAIREFDTDIRILVLSGVDRREVVEQALSAGINGYLLKDFLLEDLHASLEAVRDGQCFLSPKVQDASSFKSAPTGIAEGDAALTSRQLEILRLVASGKTTKEIARDLGISPKTVEYHRARLMERIGVRDVTGLTRFAVQNGVCWQ